MFLPRLVTPCHHHHDGRCSAFSAWWSSCFAPAGTSSSGRSRASGKSLAFNLTSWRPCRTSSEARSTALSHAADLLLHDRLTSEALRRQAYDVLARDTSRLRSLVEGLLEFGRIEAGAAAFRFTTLDVSTVVESTVAEFRDRVSADGYVIELARHPDDVYASVDREALSRALWNLLDNAVKVLA